jgi:hypothetical protein
MTTSAPIPGTAFPLQFEATSQDPLVELVQLIVNSRLCSSDSIQGTAFRPRRPQSRRPRARKIERGKWKLIVGGSEVRYAELFRRRRNNATMWSVRAKCSGTRTNHFELNATSFPEQGQTTRQETHRLV